MANDHARAVDTPRHRALGAHDLFRFMLGAQVGIVEVFRLGEHVFAEHALVEAGSGNGTHVVESPGLDLAGKLHGFTGALGVGAYLRGFVGGDVVDGGEVEKVGDLAGERGAVFFTDPEQRLVEVAAYGLDAVAVVARLLAQGGELVFGAFTTST